MATSSEGGGGAPGNGAAGYDGVKVPTADGQGRLMTRAEFEGLPLPERVKHLMGGKLVFYRDGSVVAAREALRNS
jgi:hypothetical protein